LLKDLISCKVVRNLSTGEFYMARKRSEQGQFPDEEMPQEVRKDQAEGDLYFSRIRICNPYQKVYMHDIPQPIAKMDGWWLAQINAGVIQKTKC
jgi:hypothetical protein